MPEKTSAYEYLYAIAEILLVESIKGCCTTCGRNHFAAVAFFGKISPIRRICAPTPLSFSSMCS